MEDPTLRLKDQRNETDRKGYAHLNGNLAPVQRIFCGVFNKLTDEFKLSDGYSRIWMMREGLLIVDPASQVRLDIYTVADGGEASSNYDSYNSPQALKTARDMETTAKNVNDLALQSKILKTGTINAVKNASVKLGGIKRTDARACYAFVKPFLVSLDKALVDNKVTTKNISADIKYAIIVARAKGVCADKICTLLTAINQGDVRQGGDVAVLIVALNQLKANGAGGGAKTRLTLEIFNNYFNI